MTRYPLYFNPGDDEIRVFKYLDAASVVVPLTGYTAQWTGTVGDQTVNVTGTVDGANGKVTVELSSAQTTTLSTGGTNGHYEVVVTSSGGKPTTIVHGPLVMQSH